MTIKPFFFCLLLSAANQNLNNHENKEPAKGRVWPAHEKRPPHTHERKTTAQWKVLCALCANKRKFFMCFLAFYIYAIDRYPNILRISLLSLLVHAGSDSSSSPKWICINSHSMNFAYINTNENELNLICFECTIHDEIDARRMATRPTIRIFFSFVYVFPVCTSLATNRWNEKHQLQSYRAYFVCCCDTNAPVAASTN